MIEKPLIYTTLGHLAIDQLTHDVEWTIAPEQIIFVETYRLDGVVVKQSSHVKVLTGSVSAGEASI